MFRLSEGWKSEIKVCLQGYPSHFKGPGGRLPLALSHGSSPLSWAIQCQTVCLHKAFGVVYPSLLYHHWFLHIRP